MTLVIIHVMGKKIKFDKLYRQLKVPESRLITQIPLELHDDLRFASRVFKIPIREIVTEAIEARLDLIDIPRRLKKKK